MRALAAALLALAVACGSSTAPNPMSAAVGVYYLRTVNDSGLPYLESSSNGTTMSIAAVTLRLHSDTTFDQNILETYSRLGQNSTIQTVNQGPFTLVGSALTLKYLDLNGNGTTTGRVGRDTIWLQDGPRTSVYTKYQ